MDKQKVLTLAKDIDNAVDGVGLRLSELITELSKQETEPDRPHPSEPGQLVCPFAKQYKNRMKTRGKYPKGYPEGLVVHFSAGHCDDMDDAINTIEYGITQGYAYWVIDPNGTIIQTHSLGEYGFHSGTSKWGDYQTCTPYFLGVEICSAGKLDDNNVSWFKKKYEASRVRVIEKDNGTMLKGHWLAYTSEQENALIQLCLWLKRNSPNVFNFDNVVGHQEIALPLGRKNDPGSTLSMTMDDLRKLLKEKYEG